MTGLDSFGYNYPLRAMVAGPYLGGQGEHEAMYPIRFTDSKNQPLTGNNQYEVKLASAPQVNAFWSLTMYDASDKMLVDNEINRYKVGTDTQGLKVASDGSITIPISHKNLKAKMQLIGYQRRKEASMCSYAWTSLRKTCCQGNGSYRN